MASTTAMKCTTTAALGRTAARPASRRAATIVRSSTDNNTSTPEATPVQPVRASAPHARMPD